MQEGLPGKRRKNQYQNGRAAMEWLPSLQPKRVDVLSEGDAKIDRSRDL